MLAEMGHDWATGQAADALQETLAGHRAWVTEQAMVELAAVRQMAAAVMAQPVSDMAMGLEQQGMVGWWTASSGQGAIGQEA